MHLFEVADASWQHGVQVQRLALRREERRACMQPAQRVTARSSSLPHLPQVKVAQIVDRQAPRLHDLLLEWTLMIRGAPRSELGSPHLSALEFEAAHAV